MKKGLYTTILGAIAALTVTALLLFGCDALLGPDTPAGNNKGNLIISFGDNQGTALAVTSGTDLPSGVLASLRYELTLTGPDGETLEHAVTGGGSLNLTVSLGQWRIDARAYQQDALAGTGSRVFTVVPGNNSIRVPMMINGGYFDIGTGSMTGGTVTANFGAAFPGTTITLTVTPGSSYTFKNGTLKYNDGSDHVISGPPYSFTMPASDITVSAGFEQTGFTAASDTEFAAALAAIQAGSANLRFTITATADISLAPQDLSLAAYTDKTIVLKGNAPTRTLSLASAGSLFTVGTDVALELENIVLQGISANTAALVYVDHGALKLNAGGKITGNEHVSTAVRAFGGGVYITDGSLTIAGGEVSLNTMTNTNENNYGIGVFAVNSAIAMTSGAIRNNTSVVTASATDKAGSGGGGICLENSSFVFSGGVIEGNDLDSTNSVSGASCLGGGVFINNGTFTMSGGTIRGNSIYAASSSWTYAFGGGVYVVNGGSFTMSGGVINGNSVTSNRIPNTLSGSQYNLGSWGGGVALEGSSSSMVKTGGLIYGGEVAGFDADGFDLKNLAGVDASSIGGGNAVQAGCNTTSQKTRNLTANPLDPMDSTVSGPSGGWDY